MHKIFPTLLFIFSISAVAQIGIGTTEPEAELDVKSQNAGILFPRIALTQNNLAAPVIDPNTGTSSVINTTLIYNTSTTSGTTAVSPGIYSYFFGYWIKVSTSTPANADWYNLNSSTSPNSLANYIFTNGKVGIGTGANTEDLKGKLHIYEATGTTPSTSSGSLYLEHGDDGGSSSIAFKSINNYNSDYAYISYIDNNSIGGDENSMLEIAGLNDGASNGYTGQRDNINFKSSNSVGINTTNPSSSASLDLGTSNQGILINRVSLTSRTDTNTIAGTEPDGLLVYNTATAGTSPQNVTEGFYYWDNSQWNRVALQANYGSASYQKGVQYYSYDTSEQNSPNISSIEINNVLSKSGNYTGALNSSSAMTTMDPSTNGNGFVIKITGTYIVQNAGTFNFSSESDDGARIYIDGALVSSAWYNGSNGINLTASGAAYLAKGKHEFEFWYYQFNSPKNFTFSWGSNPDGNTGTINAQQFIIEK
ncbi:PA14 domain-containing protein [Mesonia sp.]|uniref:PA14 domain-containing protein n=1 Tax=Mesonia sp. TaxID=1960830 RepID=UPI001754299E|nr:PA14 domain-containing protein [Mesonia sp.]HIB37078.1 hypothetical protein [Mesonia sp.]HIO26721.1 hypothetical protein [Flavobacteriaceae bacterium]